jgi:hypothetical protein
MPPQVEVVAQTFLREIGRLAGRAVAAGARSVVRDVGRVGKEVQRRAQVAESRLEKIVSEDDKWDR